jgi:hypothetical protein
MQKIKDILYILGVNCLIIFFALNIGVNLIELLHPIPKTALDMILGIITYFICKDITKILIKEVKEANKNKENRIIAKK